MIYSIQMGFTKKVVRLIELLNGIIGRDFIQGSEKLNIFNLLLHNT